MALKHKRQLFVAYKKKFNWRLNAHAVCIEAQRASAETSFVLLSRFVNNIKNNIDESVRGSSIQKYAGLAATEKLFVSHCKL